MSSPLLNEQLLKLLEDSRTRQQLTYAIKKRSNSDRCNYRQFLLAAKECQYLVNSQANLMQIRQCFQSFNDRMPIVKLMEMLSLEKVSVERGGMPRSRSKSVRMRIREKKEICPSIMEHTEEDDEKVDMRPVEGVKTAVVRGIPSIPSISFPATEANSQPNHARTRSRFSQPCLFQLSDPPSSCRSRILECINTQQTMLLLTSLHKQYSSIVKLFESFHKDSIGLEQFRVIVKTLRTTSNENQIDAVFGILSKEQDKITKQDLARLEQYETLAKQIEEKKEYFENDSGENISLRHRPFRNAEIVLMRSKKPSMLFLQKQDSIESSEVRRPGTSFKLVIPPKTARLLKRKKEPEPQKNPSDIELTLKQLRSRRPLERKSLPQKLRRFDPQSPRQTLTTQLRRLFNDKIRRMNEDTKVINDNPALRLESSRILHRRNKFDFSSQL